MADLSTLEKRSTPISYEEILSRIEANTPRSLFESRRVLAITPDSTRSAPLPALVRAVNEVIGPHARQLDYMVALGTHAIMSEEAIANLYGVSTADKASLFPRSRFLNHRWDIPGTLERIGSFNERQIAQATDGRFSEAVDVTINRAIFDYDLILIIGPVFPHEIVGFSGGNKYLFPGISGGEFLDFFHWLSAVITCMKTIGHKNTPARRVIDAAADLVPTPCHLVALVVQPGQDPPELSGLYVGDPQEAWSKAADHSSQIHITHTARRYHTVLGHAPTMYDELWVGGKVMYKLESVVEDGGRLIIYGPQINKLSSTWGHYLEQVGYHVVDYLIAERHRFPDVPRGVLAHAALVRGMGEYREGVERPRIRVDLATSLSPALCTRIGLGYTDPENVNLSDFRDRENEGILYVPHAGEVLHLPARNDQSLA
jgi:nickel-dependent lactate racemase